ncbi:cysteine--tRNA ligase [Thermopolyspora flexuosa]|uniref:Cysteine--tRNA ligase n=1 Tax=Thermopolyspora flexuosa TaxID=103836 RepID=A0A543J2U1_9ACTN|nr:cysteine--tRNA ligase [Thermopolyspora flexuosa]TQM77145.1 cysteinyl-tRNA synthetase [Thermopolyspora flexuosa]
MSLYLHDTSTRTVREFVPVEPGRVSIYLCGATVQAPPHIGHIRSGLNFDVLRRWLMHLGYDVWLCRNVTDIDDKIIRVAAEEGVPWFVVAERNYRLFTWAYDALGCLPPTVEPRATGHIPEMIELMARLIDKGHAYAAGGDVYFDVRSYAERYGELSNQKLENMRPAADTDTDTHKRDPRDFALWKAAKPGEPTWRTPWGPGRPGWHLECSAMATKYLGSTFDIHGGGVDLLFPHHENEQAQSRAAGDGFARYWLHNGLLTLGGEKMSKSLGNSLLVSEMLKVVRAVELRYYLVSAHYRSPIEYSEEALQEAATAYRRIEGFVTRAAEISHDVDKDDVPLPQAFVDAMNNDIGTPQAIAAIHESVREGNAALAQGNKERVARILAETEKMLDILGLNPRSEQWRTAGDDTGLRNTVDALVSVVLEQRQAARARKDYATADAIRAQLASAGIVVEDTPQGPRWELAR